MSKQDLLHSEIPKVYNCKDKNQPVCCMYVGRPSKWGNPFKIGKDGNREEVIAKFRLSLTDETKESIRRELQGKNLVCYCAPKACHADVLLEVANG